LSHSNLVVFYQGKRAKRLVQHFKSFEEFINAASEDEVDPNDVILALINTWKADTKPKLNSIPEDRGDNYSLQSNENKRERGDRQADNENFTTLFVGVGKEDDVSAGQLTGIFYNECKLPQGAVGKIRLFGRHSLVGIAKDSVDDVLNSRLKIQNRQVPIRPDRGFKGGRDERKGSGNGGDFRRRGSRRDRDSDGPRRRRRG